jgi:hypothetical protein
MSSEAEVPYYAKATSKYQGQIMPQESMISVDPELRKARGLYLKKLEDEKEASRVEAA